MPRTGASSTNRAVVLSFSGIDGAGKSTQIKNLSDSLRASGYAVRLLVFWDDIAMLRRSRELAGYAAFRGERGIGSPEKPINRRDKNVRAWYLTIARSLLYFLDAMSLTYHVLRSSRSGADVIVCDRYLYDELANLPSKPAAQVFARLLLRCAPRPDIAFLLDADPVQARLRKPEYPLEFLCENRAAYLEISRRAGMTLIGPLPREEVSDQVLRRTLAKLAPTAGTDAVGDRISDSGLRAASRASIK